MDQHLESDFKQKLNTSTFYDYINVNFNAVYKQWQQTQQFHYNFNVTLFSNQSSSSLLMYFTINPQTLASIVA